MKIHPLPVLAFLRFYVGFALAGATMLWTVACSSMLLNTAPRSFAPMRTFKHILPQTSSDRVKPRASFERESPRNPLLWSQVALSRVVRSEPARSTQTGSLLRDEPGSFQTLSARSAVLQADSGRRCPMTSGQYDRAKPQATCSSTNRIDEGRAIRSGRVVTGWRDSHFITQSRTLPSKTEAPSGRRSGAGTFDRAAEVKIPRVPNNVTDRRDGHFTPWRGDYLAAQHLCGLDVRLMAAVVKAESGGDPWALSSSGARGLMQVLESTAAELGDFNLWVPAENLIAGSCILRQHIDYRRGDVLAALADYHAGRYRARTSAQTLAYAADILSFSGGNE